MNDDSVLSPLDPNGAALRRPDDGDATLVSHAPTGANALIDRSFHQRVHNMTFQLADLPAGVLVE
jgi:hypothetical protein